MSNDALWAGLIGFGVGAALSSPGTPYSGNMNLNFGFNDPGCYGGFGRFGGGGGYPYGGGGGYGGACGPSFGGGFCPPPMPYSYQPGINLSFCF